MHITLHETSGVAEYRNVLDRARRAPKPGGTVVGSETPLPDEPTTYRSHPVYMAMAGVQLHEAFVGRGMITQSKLRDHAGGSGVRQRPGGDPAHAESPRDDRLQLRPRGMTRSDGRV